MVDMFPALIPLKSRCVEAEYPPVGGSESLESGVPAQVLSSLLDCGSELRSPLPITLVFLQTVALSTIQVTVRFGSIQPQFRKNTLGGGQRPPTSLPPTSREDLWLDGYLEYPHAVQALYIYKHPCLLRDSSPVPTAQESASLTTIPDGD
ncbi:uncharacterized protein TNCV_5008281 [Trichonephila clavipes]|nr:uncharacterized protein TNCV_5008281 [Trichonephila clavipes]